MGFIKATQLLIAIAPPPVASQALGPAPAGGGAQLGHTPLAALTTAAPTRLVHRPPVWKRLARDLCQIGNCQAAPWTAIGDITSEHPCTCISFSCIATPPGLPAPPKGAEGAVGPAGSGRVRGGAPAGGATELEGATGLIRFLPNQTSPPDVRLTMQQLRSGRYEEVGASYAQGSSQGVHLYLQPFLRSACNHTHPDVVVV